MNVYPRKVREKGARLLKSAEKQSKADPAFRASLSVVTSPEELELLAKPLKEKTTTLAAKAKSLGLDVPAKRILAGELR